MVGANGMWLSLEVPSCQLMVVYTIRQLESLPICNARWFTNLILINYLSAATKNFSIYPLRPNSLQKEISYSIECFTYQIALDYYCLW